MAGQQKVISSTFNVSTVDETVSLQAQYAPNANPTSSQIHDTWQSGDLYMRTKMTNETTWSDWHRIVGEGGDETDYTFAISQYKTTSSATTAPSDISTWSDAPMAVTTAKPYLWARVQKKVWDDALQDYVVDSTRYIRLTGEDGTSVMAQYAPNDNPSVSQIHDTWQSGDLYMRTKSTSDSNWSSWHKIVGENGGETDYSFGISSYKTTANASTAPSDISSWSDAPLEVTSAKPYLWAKVQQKSWNSSTQSYDVDSTKYIRLTGEDGSSVMAQYAPNDNPSSSQIHDTWQSGDLYMRTKSSSDSTWSSWNKIVGESGDETDYSFAISSQKTTANASTSPSDISTNDWVDAPVAITSAKPYLWARVQQKSWNASTQSYDVDSTRYIRLTGEDGEDALTLVLDTYAIAFPTDSNYSVESQITYTVGARMYLGNSSIPRTITSLTASLDVADGDIDVSRTSPANGVVIDLGEARFANIIGVNVTAVCADGTRTAKIILTAAPKGENGTRGKIGRFFYYEGEWNDFASTDDFDVTDAQAPYFHYDNNYWVFNPETNGTYTKQDMGTPSSSSSNWKLMTNDFKYLITEAIFGSYAHFGSFIINGDWMISQHGVIYDTNGGIHTIDANHSYGNYNVNNAYTLFDVDYPNSSKPNANNFVPNFAVDGRTGATYQNKAQIRGELDVRELGQNAGWILSPFLEQDYYKIPSIDGFDKDGILTMRLLFDGDDSDGYAPREGGGLLINEKKWNASTQKYEPYNVARYNREAWCVSSTDHPDDSYMFGGMSSEEPYIHGKTYIQSNQTHKEFYLGITSLGLWFQSDSWQTYRSNMQDGEVYVDDWDNLMVKNSRSYKQFNVVRGNCTLPSGCPVGTVYYVKGTGATTVSVTSGSNDWIEGWDDNDNKGNSAAIQSNSVQFVKTDTHIWTMFIGI